MTEKDAKTPKKAVESEKTAQKREIEPGEIQWQTILVHHSPAVVKAHGWLKYLWGLDIFFGPIPFGKTLLLLNLIVWYLLKGV